MNTYLSVFFLLFFVLGLLFNFLLFRQDEESKQGADKKKKFEYFTSKRFFVFIIEIMIAVIGFGITLGVTNANERRVEKEKAATMIQQVIEFTDRQIVRERAYLNEYNSGKRSATSLKYSNVINLDYYNNILSSEVVLQNANMNTYGNLMTYLTWIKQRNELAMEAEDEGVYGYMYQRYEHLKKLQMFLIVCKDELSGVITAEEAKQKCHDIAYPPSTEATVPATS